MANGDDTGNAPSMWEKLTGKRTGNITLPQQGPADPRLPAQRGVYAQAAPKIKQGLAILRQKGILNGRPKPADRKTGR